MADMKRINRMVRILSMIERGGKVTPKGLAGHFNASERSIYRDIKELIVDFPIHFDDEKGSYRFVDGYSLKKLDLSTDEVKAMLASKGVVSKLGAGLSKAYDSLMCKIKAEAGHKTGRRFQNADTPYWFDIDPVDDFSKVQKQFDAVQQALDEGISLQITYEAMGDQKVTERLIDPYGLFYSHGVWYTIAHCHAKDDIREFALDCIKNVQVTHKSYNIPKNFNMDDYFKTGWHIITYGKPVAVRIWFSREVARWITRRKWHPTQKIETKKDGAIVLTVTVNGTMEIKRWVYNWGPECEVLAPLELRKEVAAELRAMAGVYSKTNKPKPH